MEEKLRASQFIRIHKSYIVSVSRIERFIAHTVEDPKQRIAHWAKMREMWSPID